MISVPRTTSTLLRRKTSASSRARTVWRPISGENPIASPSAHAAASRSGRSWTPTTSSKRVRKRSKIALTAPRLAGAVDQRDPQHFLGARDEVEAGLRARRRRQLGEIALVLPRQADVVDARAQRRQDLLLDPADREDLAAQRDLAGHREVVAHRPADRGGGEGAQHRDAGRRPVLGDRAGRDVDVERVVVEEGRRDAEAARRWRAGRRARPGRTPSSPRRGGR